MKVLITLFSFCVLISSCEKRDHMCVCTGTSIMGGTYTKSYMIHETKRKAQRQCKKTDREPLKLNLFAPDCSLH